MSTNTTTIVSTSRNIGSGTGGPKVVNVFGGPQMSLEFEQWCKKQLTKLSKSADISLAHYLMTLDNPTLIRETITQYLGESTGVKEFADGFLQNKGFETGKDVSKVKAKSSVSKNENTKNETNKNSGGGGWEEQKKSRRSRRK